MCSCVCMICELPQTDSQAAAVDSWIPLSLPFSLYLFLSLSLSLSFSLSLSLSLSVTTLTFFPPYMWTDGYTETASRNALHTNELMG